MPIGKALDDRPTPHNDTKECVHCKKVKNLSEFTPRFAYTLGADSYCKPCRTEQKTVKNRAVSLSKKPYCARQECSNRIGLHKTKYCSTECSDSVNSKIKWEKQKARGEEYKAYHREKARIWARKNYKSRKGGYYV